MNQRIYLTCLAAIVTGTFPLVANTARANMSNSSLVAVEFRLPEEDSVPSTNIGERARGRVQFALPSAVRSNGTIGNGLVDNLSFTPPEDEAQPESSIGGSVRGDEELAFPGEANGNDLNFTPPEDEQQPGQTVGAGSRGDLPDNGINANHKIPLTALVPPTQHGRTVAARPTIYAYLPPIGAETLFFSLQDEAGNFHYHTRLEVDADGGVVSITLTPEAAALELDRNYLWYLAPIEPGGVLRPDNYAVTGWVKRVAFSANQPELASDPIELASEYARAGIWYDTLKVLVEAQHSQPDNPILAQEWHELLAQVGLEAIASEPIHVVN